MARTTFRRNLTRVLTSSVASQAIAVLALPIIARLIDPSEFGVFGMVAAVVGISASFFTWQFDKFIPLSRHRDLALQLFVVGFGFTILWALVSFFGIWLLEDRLLAWIEAPNAIAILYLVPLAMFARGVQRLLHFSHVWRGNLTSVGLSRIVQALSDMAISVALVYVGLGALALTIGLTLSLILSLVPMALAARDLGSGLNRVTWPRLRQAYRLRINDASLASGILVTNSLSANVAILMFGLFFSAAELGVFALVRRAALMPLGIVSFSMSLSFWSQISDLCKNRAFGKAKAFYFRILRYFALGSVVFAALVYVGSLFATEILGEDWAGADQVLLALIPMLVGTLLFGSTNHLVSLGYQKLQIFADGLRLLGTAGFIFAAKTAEVDFITCVWGVSLINLASYVVLFLMHLRAYRLVEATIARDATGSG